MSEEKENKHKLGKLTLARIFAAILAFVLVFVSVYYLEGYYAKKYRGKEKNSNTITQNQQVVENEKLDKITQFELIIRKINVSVPVIPNVNGQSSDLYNEALKKGVAHYKGTALPASGSNVLIFGHSSSIFGTGTYDKIFSRLNELQKSDLVIIKFNGKEYKYLVFDKKITLSGDVSIITPTEREQLTLMTCWPIGADKERLVIITKPQK